MEVARASSCRQLSGYVADRTGAHREHDVAIARERPNRRRHLIDVLNEYRLDTSGDTNGACECTTVRCNEWSLACGIDVGEHKCVDRRKHANELLEQIARSRIPVRLKR